MHDCRVIQEELIDLACGELTPERERRMRAELAACAGCRDEYDALAETFAAVAQSAAVVMPPEDFWPGYEDRLRARIAKEGRGDRAGLRSLFTMPDWFGLTPRFAFAALAVLVLAAGAWLALRSVGDRKAPVNIARGGQQATPAATPAATKSPAKLPEARDPEAIPPRAEVAGAMPRGTKQTRKPKARPMATQPEENATRPAENLPASMPAPVNVLLANPDLARHFEQAGMLLRSFRNFAAEGASNLAFEKGRSRELLYQNVLLRRSAEESGNLPVADLLGALEPVLLDIKNLPDSAGLEDLREINDRIRRKGLVSTLNIYAAQNIAANEPRGGRF